MDQTDIESRTPTTPTTNTTNTESANSISLDEIKNNTSQDTTDNTHTLRERKAQPVKYKTLIFIRHGESTHNLKFRECTTWWSCQCFNINLRDSPLSSQGKAQVEKVRKQLETSHVQVQVVLTSPLTRALQTAQIAFAKTNVPIEVNALQREAIRNRCDIGRSPDVLAKEFPSIDFTKLEKVWWYTSQVKSPNCKSMREPLEPESVVDERVQQFRSYLQSRSEECIGIIGHSLFFKKLTNRSFENAEMRRLFMDPEGNMIDPAQKIRKCF